MRHASTLALAVVLCGRGARAGPALSLTGEAAAGGGYDTNLFLDVVPDPTSPRYHEARGAFYRLAPAATGTLGAGGAALELRYDADLRDSEAGGLLVGQEATVAVRPPPLGPARVRIALAGVRFAPTRFHEDRFLSLDGLLDVAVRPAAIVRTWARYSLGGRRYPDASTNPAEIDVTQAADAGVAWVPLATLDVALGARYLGIRPDSGSALDRGRAGLDVRALPTSRLALAASAWAGAQRIAGVRSDRQAGGALNARLRIADHLDAVAAYEVLRIASGDPAADLWRHVVSIGVEVHASLRSVPPPAPAGRKPFEPEVRDGSVRFRLLAPAAREVRLAGSWDGWSASAAFGRGDAGTWQVDVSLQPGRHRYRFLVDGQAVRPPDAEGYAADDFGGEDGLVTVP